MTERKRDLCLGGEQSWKGLLIEGCLRTVKGWQFGIIMVICLRPRTPRSTLNECSMCGESTRAVLTFITVWKPFAHSYLLIVSVCSKDTVVGVGLLLWRPCCVMSPLLRVADIEFWLVREAACWLKVNGGAAWTWASCMLLCNWLIKKNQLQLWAKQSHTTGPISRHWDILRRDIAVISTT